MDNPSAQAPDGGRGRIETWEYDKLNTQHTGPTAVTRQGKSYKITGKLQSRNAQHSVPFEFDDTCP